MPIAPSPYDFMHPQGNLFARVILPGLEQQWQLSYNEALMQRQEAREDAKTMAQFHLEFGKAMDTEIARYEKFIADAEKDYQSALQSGNTEAWRKKYDRDVIQFKEEAQTARQNASEFGRSSRAGARDRAILGKDAQEQQWEEKKAEIDQGKTVWNNVSSNQSTYRQAYDAAMSKYVGGVLGSDTDPTQAGRDPSSEDLRIVTRQLLELSPQEKARRGGNPSLTIIDGIYDTWHDAPSRKRAIDVVRDEIRNLNNPAQLAEFDKLHSIRDSLDLSKSDFMEQTKSAGAGNPAYQRIQTKEFTPRTELGDAEQAMLEAISPDAAALETLKQGYQRRIDEARNKQGEAYGALGGYLSGDSSINTIDAARRIFASRFGGAGRTSRLNDELALLSPAELSEAKSLAYRKLHELPPVPPQEIPAMRAQSPQSANRLGATEPIPSSVGGPEDRAFNSWYQFWSDKTGLDPNPDSPEHRYDYRAAFKAGATPTWDQSLQEWHWPSEFKADNHLNRFIQEKDGSWYDSKNDRLATPEDAPLIKQQQVEKGEDVETPAPTGRPPIINKGTTLPGGTGQLMPIPSPSGKARKVNMPFDPAKPPQQVALSKDMPKARAQEHLEGLQRAMIVGKQLSMQPKRLDRLIATDPVSKEAARLFTIDTRNKVPLQDQVTKITKAWADDPVKQQRALQILYALRAKDTNSHYLQLPNKEVNLAKVS